MASATDTSSFYKTELKRALSEQAFGIIGYSFTRSSAYEASASVHLLEKEHLDITLTVRGFQVTNGSSASGKDVVFETLDALLHHYSPLYAAKRTEVLFAKLSA